MLVSIVILNWNDGIENCRAAIQSALEQDYQNKEILFVDNGSTDGSLQAVRQEFPLLRFIEIETNLGCPGGRNVGASAAKGELIFFLETDAVWASNDVVSGAVGIFENHPKIGALYMRVEGYQSREPDSPLDGTVPASTEKGLFLSSSFRGGASAIRKALFDAVGQFPADFFRQYEERYVSLLMYQHGFQVVYWPERTLRHKGSDYQGKSTSVVRYNCVNELKTIHRVYPNGFWLLYFVMKSLIWTLRLLRSGQSVLLREIFDIMLKDMKAAGVKERIDWQTLRHINAIRYGHLDTRLQP